MIGASAALHLSPIPFLHPTGSVRIGRVGGELIVMPTHSQLEESDLDLIVSGTRKAITMIEGFAREMAEDQMLQAILAGHKVIVEIVDLIEELRDKAGLGKKVLPPAAAPNPLIEEFRAKFGAEFRQRKQTSGKADRAAAIDELKQRIVAEYLPEDGEAKVTPEQVSAAFSALEERVVRDMILEGKRIDGRGPKDIRPIECEVGVLPRTHGSALFQRGETQALVHDGAGHVQRRAARGRPDGRVQQEVHAGLQLPAVLGRRVPADPRPRPARDRPRRPGRAQPQSRHPGHGRVPLHDPPRLRHSGVEWVVEHGVGVRRHPVADGRRRADRRRRWPASRSAWSRRRASSRS